MNRKKVANQYPPLQLDSTNSYGIVLGIDASNLRDGGGRTHLIELISHAIPQDYGFTKVVIWGSDATLSLLPSHDWLVKRNPLALEKGIISRSLWQRFKIAKAAKLDGCHIIFTPGGLHSGSFHPVVTMSQNMLPFEWKELFRYGLSLKSLRLLLLRVTQTRSFKRAEGVIFLTNYAREMVQTISGKLPGKIQIIPHGISLRFRCAPRPQKSIIEYTPLNPYRLIYVSIIDNYKHQWSVVESVAKLRTNYGWPLTLDLVGSAYPPALARLLKVIEKFDPNKVWINYRGVVPYTELHTLYKSSDLGIFASSCENMPIILLETMAAGLPVACSNRGPMPEILGERGLYFDPENISEIIHALEDLIGNPMLRTNLVNLSYECAKNYTWESCSRQTFEFLSDVYHQWSKNK